MDNIILTYIKRGLTGLMLLVVATVFTSCDLSSFRDAVNGRSISPKDYQTEIEDFVKYDISVDNVMEKLYTNEFSIYSIFYSWDEYCEMIDEFDEKLNGLLSDEESENGYMAVLQALSNTPNHRFQHLAEEVLKEYNNTLVILSEFKQLSTSSDKKVWKFKELSSGINYLFYLDEETWNCIRE